VSLVWVWWYAYLPFTLAPQFITLKVPFAHVPLSVRVNDTRLASSSFPYIRSRIIRACFIGVVRFSLHPVPQFGLCLAFFVC
jgi:hypothetical protein